MAFLHGVPTSGADGLLVALGIVTGAACGLIGALATRLDVESGEVIAAATPVAYAVTVRCATPSSIDQSHGELNASGRPEAARRRARGRPAMRP
jgi:hypothetical protein